MIPFGIPGPFVPVVPVNGVIIPGRRRMRDHINRDVGRVEGYAAAMRDLRAMERMRAFDNGGSRSKDPEPKEPKDAYQQYKHYKDKHYEYRALLAPPGGEEGQVKEGKSSKEGTAVTKDAFDKYMQHKGKSKPASTVVFNPGSSQKATTSSGTAVTQDAYQKYLNHKEKHYEYRGMFEEEAPIQGRTSGGTPVTNDAMRKYWDRKTREDEQRRAREAQQEMQERQPSERRRGVVEVQPRRRFQQPPSFLG
ncbi:Hypothetical predicted protein [Lecanosticta acicola]|uniref:Uncharacterized protein n=1 Tax=Lecanosticta acicola TaxID=111012 RepID=A0AAI8Z8J2_9PEZI|nr:Hypothetical predicted protein [Lecanosticta acicola]